MGDLTDTTGRRGVPCESRVTGWGITQEPKGDTRGGVVRDSIEVSSLRTCSEDPVGRSAAGDFGFPRRRRAGVGGGDLR